LANITTEMIKELRQATSAGVLDCRNALQEAKGNMERAVEILRRKGLASAEKKAGRSANQGVIGSYVHAGSRVAGMVELNCETDFVARTPEFQELAKELAMQVVAMNPRWVSVADVPESVIEREKDLYRHQALEEGKPEHVVDRIVEGRLEKFFDQVCLMRQPYIRDGEVTIEELIKEKIAQVGENIVVRRFVRMAVGENE